MKSIYYYDTPFFKAGIAEQDSAITDLLFWKDGELAPFSPDQVTLQETPLLKQAYIQLTEYLDGKRTSFSLPLAPYGTAFQKKVWDALIAIPYGETRSYQDIARAIGNPKACRAVGNANHNNPISIFIPCHRVITSQGTLGGYGGGLDVKKKLLALEQQKLGSHLPLETKK